MKIDLGDFEVVVMGVHLPIRKESHSTQMSIAEDLSEILKSRLAEKYDADFELQIQDISSGCIKIRYKMWAKVVATVATVAAFVQAYPDLRAGAILLWGDANSAIEFVSQERECRAQLSRNELGASVYGPVKRGQSLSVIAQEIRSSCEDFEDIEIEQIMAAIYHQNRTAFIDDDINLIVENAIIVVPEEESIRRHYSYEFSIKFLRQHKTYS